MKIVWSPTARNDLAHIHNYIFEENSDSAVKVARALVAATRRLEEFPESGRPGRIPTTRELVIPGTPYVIPYTVRDDMLWIITVLHTSRTWPDRF